MDTNVPLDAEETWESDPLPTRSYTHITGSVYASVEGTVYIEQSEDQENWDISTSYEVESHDGKGFKEELFLPWVRVRYVNGSASQTVFRLNSYLKNLI